MASWAVCIGFIIVCLIIGKVCDIARERYLKRSRKEITKLTGEVFCIDCENCMRDKSLGADFSKCKRTKEEEDRRADYLVIGSPIKKTYRYLFCATERGSNREDACGATGKFYVEKK